MKFLSLIILSALFTSCGFEIVDDGYVGVKRSLGKIEKEEYPAGMHFYNPFTTGIFEMEIREKTWKSNAQSYSLDNQIIEATFQINYKPTPSQMAELYIDKGERYADVILPQRVEASIKEVLGKYRATELVQVRNKVNNEIKKLLNERLNGTHINLAGFEITNFDYDDDFERAVKAKIVAKERAIEEQNRTVQVKEQAAQKVLKARADAEAIKVKASALARNKDLIQLEAVKKWDGKMPRYMMGNSVPFIKLGSK